MLAAPLSFSPAGGGGAALPGLPGRHLAGLRGRGGAQPTLRWVRGWAGALLTLLWPSLAASWMWVPWCSAALCTSALVPACSAPPHVPAGPAACPQRPLVQDEAWPEPAGAAHPRTHSSVHGQTEALYLFCYAHDVVHTLCANIIRTPQAGGCNTQRGLTNTYASWSRPTAHRKERPASLRLIGGDCLHHAPSYAAQPLLGLSTAQLRSTCSRARPHGKSHEKMLSLAAPASQPAPTQRSSLAHVEAHAWPASAPCTAISPSIPPATLLPTSALPSTCQKGAPEALCSRHLAGGALSRRSSCPAGHCQVRVQGPAPAAHRFAVLALRPWPGRPCPAGRPPAWHL